MSARTMIWTPVPTAKLQQDLHRAGAGPAMLVPVPSGTVLLPSPLTKLQDALLLAKACRKIGGRALLVCWNGEAAISYTLLTRVPGTWFWGSNDAVNRLSGEQMQYGGLLNALLGWTTRLWRKPARRDRAARDLATVLGTATDLTPHVSAWERGGRDSVTTLLRLAGRDPSAQVAELVDQGQAEPWLRQLPRPPRPLPVVTLVVVYGALLTVPTVVFALPTWVFLAAYLAVALPLLLLQDVFRRRPVRGKPVNAVLPVIPVTQGAAPTE